MLSPERPVTLLLRVSRPRFWAYLVGPFLLTVTALATRGASPLSLFLCIAWGFWLALFGNLFLYGVNDLYDEETDARNAKKEGYEARVNAKTRPLLQRSVVVSVLLGCVLFFLTVVQPSTQRFWLALGFFGYLVLGWQYSASPLRFKARPFLDSTTNILYLFPVFIAWSLFSAASFPWLVFLAGSLWCMAMHAFSAIPDIRADKDAGLSTIATELGAPKTILLCTLLYLGACLLAFPWVHWVSLIGIGVYGSLMLLAWGVQNKQEELFRVYTWFPYMNTVLGFLLWMRIALSN